MIIDLVCVKFKPCTYILQMFLTGSFYVNVAKGTVKYYSAAYDTKLKLNE